MTLRAVAVAAGALFGFVLSWARIVDPVVIRDMLHLRDPYVFLMMGSAMATGAVGFRLLRRLGARAVLDGAPVTWATTAPTRDHVVGSVLFGTGWALAGTCPGPALAQLGGGHVGAVATVAGLLVGVALRGAVQRTRAPSAVTSAPVAGL